MPVVNFFCEIATQWRHGMAGPTGLDYNVVFAELKRQGYTGRKYQKMLDALRAMECEALSIMHKK